VSEAVAPRHPLGFRLYYGAVLAAAVAAFIAFTPHAGRVDPATAVVVLLLMVLSEATAVPLPGGGYVSVGAVLDLACLLILGPVYTAWFNVLATLITQALVLRKPPVRVVHNMAIFGLTAFAAGYAFIATGGRVGHLEVARDILPLLTCGIVYFLCNSIFVSTVIGLTTGPGIWRQWQRIFLHGMLHHLSFIALGTLIAVVYLGVGPVGLVLFGIPFLVARHSFQLYVEIRNDLKDFVRALSEVLEEVDPYTRQHSVRVSQYAIRLARGLKLSEREVDEIEYAALVHDLGKIGPHHQHILQKPGSLSHEEQRTLRGHPAAGAEIIKRVRALKRSAEIVRSHHERPDGRGYPFGLMSDDVPVGARILNVSDAFDAMTSDRPYRRALSVDSALRELDQGAGTQFDREVVACLLRLNAQGQFPLIPSPSSEELRMLRVRPRRAQA
jgi:putative nucleotidyltransferase with HDIG domain